MNNLKTLILLALLTGLFIWIGQMLGGNRGMIIAFGLAIALNGISYWFSDKIVLGIYRAKEIKEGDDPWLHSTVRKLATMAELPMPRLYSIPQPTPNAFATGRNPEHAVVAVTEGIRELLSKDEFEGVLAHELAHIKNRDILIGSISAVLAGAVMMLSRFAYFAALFGGRGSDRRGGGLELLVMMIVTPIAALLIQMAISRTREYKADATGARICHKPNSLADALEKLSGYSKRKPLKVNASTSHMFIVNPLTGKSILNAFSTHPPLEKRVEKLRAMKI